jgi:hypothetical protein
MATSVDNYGDINLEGVGLVDPSMLDDHVAWLRSFGDGGEPGTPEHHAAGLAKLAGVLLARCEAVTPAPNAETRTERLGALLKEYPGAWAPACDGEPLEQMAKCRFVSIGQDDYDGAWWLELHTSVHDALSYLGDHTLMKWEPKGVIDLDTGESLSIEVGAPVVSLAVDGAGCSCDVPWRS